MKEPNKKEQRQETADKLLAILQTNKEKSFSQRSHRKEVDGIA